MKRVKIIAGGDVQSVGYREYVRKATFNTGISGYVKNLKSGDVEIVAEGEEIKLKKLLDDINVTRYPVDVKSFSVTWEEASDKYNGFKIIRGNKDDELFERIDVAGALLYIVVENSSLSLVKQDQMLEKQDQMLNKQDQMLEKQDQMLNKQDQILEKQDQMLEIQDSQMSIQKETLEEMKGFRKDTTNYLENEFEMIKRKLNAIENALSREGITV